MKFHCADRDDASSVTLTPTETVSSRDVALMAAQSFNEHGHGFIQWVGDKWISERIIDVTAESGFVESFIVSVQHTERYKIRRFRKQDEECRFTIRGNTGGIMDRPDIDRVVDAIHELALNGEKFKASELQKAIKFKFGDRCNEAVTLNIKELSCRLCMLWWELHR